MRLLFLDDNKNRHKIFRQRTIGFGTVDHAYTAREALVLLTTNDYDMVFLDHDLDETTLNELNDEEEDGRWLCKQIVVNTDIDINTSIVIHSLNYEGSMEMSEILEKFENVAIYPFVWRSINKDDDGHIIFTKPSYVYGADC